jgi:hypothetical protein
LILYIINLNNKKRLEMDKNDDEVLQGEAFGAYPEEAIPLVIFNEEKKCK